MYPREDEGTHGSRQRLPQFGPLYWERIWLNRSLFEPKWAEVIDLWVLRDKLGHIQCNKRGFPIGKWSFGQLKVKCRRLGCVTRKKQTPWKRSYYQQVVVQALRAMIVEQMYKDGLVKKGDLHGCWQLMYDEILEGLKQDDRERFKAFGEDVYSLENPEDEILDGIDRIADKRRDEDDDDGPDPVAA